MSNKIKEANEKFEKEVRKEFHNLLNDIFEKIEQIMKESDSHGTHQ